MALSIRLFPARGNVLFRSTALFWFFDNSSGWAGICRRRTWVVVGVASSRQRPGVRRRTALCGGSPVPNLIASPDDRLFARSKRRSARPHSFSSLGGLLMEMRHPPELSKNHLLGDLVVTATHGRSPIRRFRSDLDSSVLSPDPSGAPVPGRRSSCIFPASFRCLS
jgi:hypothetical protein